MKAIQFTKNREVVHLLAELKEHFNGNLQVSDIIDEAGNQYIDLVQEGGGIWGIALVGYLYVLEEMGIRFFDIAGTSAGSITTLLLAAFGNPTQKKSGQLIEILANKDFSDFIDGDEDAKRFIASIVKGSGPLKLLFRALQVVDNMKDDMGLNPGNNFYKWLTGLLKENNIETTTQLINRLNTMPEKLFHRITKEEIQDKASIKIIASDITTNTKVTFPEMGHLYYKNTATVNPADFVRASMSIPIFFEPFNITEIPKGIHQQSAWDETAGYKGNVPDEILFIDGGIMSNFPIDAFHSYHKIPRKPTFGIKLREDRVESNEISNTLDLLYACFNSARKIRDFEFIFNNKDFDMLVGTVDTRDYSWIDFNQNDEDKIALFIKGVEAACSFLKNFDWATYKNYRTNNLISNLKEIKAAA